MTARKIPMQAADWSVWCWSKAENRWTEHPLDKMTVQIQDGVLSARNTTNSNWPRAILVYRGTRLDGDFIISADYRGQLESFDLQSADGGNQRLSCLNPPQDNQWHSALISRQQGQYTARIEEASVQVQDNKAPAGMKGYFCFKLRPGEAVEVRGLVVQVGK